MNIIYNSIYVKDIHEMATETDKSVTVMKYDKKGCSNNIAFVLAVVIVCLTTIICLILQNEYDLKRLYPDYGNYLRR